MIDGLIFTFDEGRHAARLDVYRSLRSARVRHARKSLTRMATRAVLEQLSTQPNERIQWLASELETTGITLASIHSIRYRPNQRSMSSGVRQGRRRDGRRLGNDGLHEPVVNLRHNEFGNCASGAWAEKYNATLNGANPGNTSSSSG